MKNCIICGKEFEPKRPHQITCGNKSCSRERGRITTKAYYQDEDHRRSRSLHQRMRRCHTLCRICGREIERGLNIDVRASNSTMHEECVVRDAVKTMQNGEKLSTAQIQRLYQRGYSLKEVKAWLSA